MTNKTFDFDKLKSIPKSETVDLTSGGIDSEFSHTESNFSTDQQPDNPTQKNNQNSSNVNAGEMFPSKLIIDIFDSVISKSASYLVSYLTNTKIAANHFAASFKEKEMIEPALKGYLDTLNFEMSPLSALVMTIGFVYGQKIISAVNITDSIAKPIVNSEPANETESAIKIKSTVKTGRPSLLQTKGVLSPYMRRKIKANE